MLHALTSRGLRVALFLAATASPAAAQWVSTPSSQWTDDVVGIGTSTPNTRLVVYEDVLSPAARIESGHKAGTALSAWATGPGGLGLHAVATSPTGTTQGLLASVASGQGTAIRAHASATSGQCYGVFSQSDSPDGYSGYFVGGKFHASVGFASIGRPYQINTSEVLAVHKHTTGWGGMYVSTNAGGLPYYGYADAGHALAYHYYDSPSDSWRLHVGGDRLTVTTGGLVGVKTTAPVYTLHVNGTAGKPGGGAWALASDRRLKKGIRDLEGSLDRMLALRGVTYEYTDPDAIGELHGRQIGVVAQEVEEVFPQWVDEGPNGYKRVTFRGFEALTIEALRELDARRAEVTRELRAENARLREQLAGVLGRLDALEAQVGER